MRIAPLLVCVVLISAPAHALPRFAAKVEQKCNLCHVNPAGSGMRNAYGSQYFAQTELAVHKVALEDIAKFQPNVSDNIALGADVRSLYIYDESVSQSSFFQMEGNIYLNAQVDDRLSITLFKGLYSGFEVFGTGYYLPFQGYFKVGKFQPSYGWYFADHSNFVRERMLWPPTYTDTGLEFGLFPGSVSFNVGFFNGTGNQFDENKGKALTARLEIRRHVGPLGTGLGGSYWRNDRPAGITEMYGPLYYLNIFKSRLIFLGEADWLKNSATDIKAFASTSELSFALMQGLWLSAKYDFHDPDIDLKKGSTGRYTIGLDFFPIGFVELEPSLRFYKDDIIGDDYIAFINTFHFFF